MGFKFRGAGPVEPVHPRVDRISLWRRPLLSCFGYVLQEPLVVPALADEYVWKGFWIHFVFFGCKSNIMDSAGTHFFSQMRSVDEFEGLPGHDVRSHFLGEVLHRVVTEPNYERVVDIHTLHVRYRRFGFSRFGCGVVLISKSWKIHVLEFRLVQNRIIIFIIFISIRHRRKRTLAGHIIRRSHTLRRFFIIIIFFIFPTVFVGFLLPDLIRCCFLQ
mmetsp:Transcript_12260/g.22303  ORF Transcript_12260/g.22303 Transcript_12260/m.22303 type:complete len:217 (+) Transcript_12260:1044-1694(+)